MQLQQAFNLWYESYSRTVGFHTSSETERKFNELVPTSLKNTDINEIKPVQILKLSENVAEKSTYYAKKITSDLVRIYNFANIILEETDKNPAYAVKYSRLTQPHKMIGFAFVDVSEVPKMLKKCNQITDYQKSSNVAFWVIVYTACRRSEVVNAKKCEFDFKRKFWRIPSERMKISNNGEHIVPLSKQLAKLLQEFFSTNNSKYAFPSNRKKTDSPISTIAPYHFLQKSGFGKKQTLHGFRKIFSTHSHNNKWLSDSIELSLHHSIKGVRGVYNRADMLDDRKELMQWWADGIDKWRGIK